MGNTVNLISELQFDREAFAAIGNPSTSKLTFVFTDNQPNGNNIGIKETAFPNIIKTGTYMPLKMADGGINFDHSGAFPLGVIASLQATKEGDLAKILGSAVLWGSERPEDVQFVKQAYASGSALNVSWELLYTDTTTDENGTTWLNDPIVKGATLVGLPAYEGRTPVLAVASKLDEYSEDELALMESAVWTTAYVNTLPDSAFLYIEPGGTKDSDGKTTPRSLRHFPYKDSSGKVDLPHLRNALARIPQANIPEDVKKRLTTKAQGILQKSEGSSMNEEENTNVQVNEEMKNSIAELTAKLAELQSAHESQETELVALREYKVAIEQEKAQAALLAERLAAFTSKGIVYSAEEVEAKKNFWLKMDNESFDYLVSELSTLKPAQASIENPAIPGTLSTDEKKDPIDIVREGLSERKNKRG